MPNRLLNSKLLAGSLGGRGSDARDTAQTDTERGSLRRAKIMELSCGRSTPDALHLESDSDELASNCTG